MAHEFFIANRIFVKENEGRKVSRPIVRISTISIALAIVVNLITVGIVVGFQKEVREKVSGFSSHAIILNGTSPDLIEGDPIRNNQAFIDSLSKDEAILSVCKTGFKPVLFQSEKNDRTILTSSGKDSVITEQNIDGALIKGVDQNYNWSFIGDNLKGGRLPNYATQEASNEILVSATLAKRLQFEVGDTVRAFFVKNQPLKRMFVVVGLYSTGLEEFDRKTVFGDLRQVQYLSDWGLKANIEVLDTLNEGYLVVKADVKGGSGFYEYDWGNGFRAAVGLKICPTNDTTFRLIVREKPDFLSENELAQTIPDTAYIEIRVSGNRNSACDFQLNDFEEINREYLDEDGNHFLIKSEEKEVEIKITNGPGNSQEYIGGLEIKYHDWDAVEEEVAALKSEILFVPSEFNEQLKVVSIREAQEDIFVWLEFLDLNVYIILILMILIGVVNVGAALMVLILVKTQFIGLMKALGANNWPIRKIFLFQASLLIRRGLIWGNVIGIGFCLLQKYTGLISLNPEVYYLSTVPIEIGWLEVVVINVIMVVICLSAMIVPSNIISRIQPSKAIRFE